MFFKVTATADFELTKLMLYHNAKRTILLFPKKTNELLLDDYLLKQYKLNLQLACLQVLNNATFMTDNHTEIIITFKNKKYDDLASLITYGTGKLSGSCILTAAFSRK